MKAYSLIVIIILLVAFTDTFLLNLKNILKFGYGINYKYEGMLAHSFDRFYTKEKRCIITLLIFGLHQISL